MHILVLREQAVIQLLQEKQPTVSQIVSYFDRKYDFKSERKSDKSEIDFSVRGRLFQFEIIFGTG